MLKCIPKFSMLRPAIVLAASLFLSACHSNKTKTAAEVLPIAVTVATPDDHSENGIQATGKIEAVQSADISARLMGAITHIYVKPGDQVRKGQLLVTINSSDIQAKKAQVNAAVAEATAQLKNAQKDFERFTNLYNKQSASAKELDNATLQFTAAKARLEGAEQMRNEVTVMLGYSALTAPFDGVVTRRMADEGSMASPGMPVLTIEQSRQLQVVITVSEPDIRRIRVGQSAMAGIKSTGEHFPCTITEFSPSSIGTGGQYPVKLSIPAANQSSLFAGMYVSVFIPVTESKNEMQQENRVLVPASSLIHKDQLTGLYTISSHNTALLRWVRTGKTNDDKVEILSGLSQGESFILQADETLYNGAPVKIK